MLSAMRQMENGGDSAIARFLGLPTLDCFMLTFVRGRPALRLVDLMLQVRVTVRVEG